MRVKNNTVLPRVLMTLVNAAIAFGGPHGRTARGAHQAFRKFDQLQNITDAQLRRSIYHAIGKKYITLTNRDKGTTIRLTAAGKELAGKAAIGMLRPPTPAIWDKNGALSFLTFRRSLRNRAMVLRRTLNESVLPKSKSQYLRFHTLVLKNSPY